MSAKSANSESKRNAKSNVSTSVDTTSGVTRSFRITVFAILIVSSLFCIYLMSDIFAPLLAALALAYMLEPLVTKIRARGTSRKKSVLIVFSGTILAVLLMLGLSIPYVINDLRADTSEVVTKDTASKKKGELDIVLMGAAPDEIRPPDSPTILRIIEFCNRHKSLNFVAEWLVTHDLRSELFALAQENAKALGGGMLAVGNMSLGLLNAASWLGLTLALFPVYLYFFMMGLSGVWGSAMSIVPPSIKDKTEKIATELGTSLSSFFRGRLVIALFIGIFTAAGFALLGLRFGIMLGLAIGFASIVPFLNVVFLIPALLIALLEFQGYGVAMGIFAVYSVGQLLDPVLTPYFLSKGTGLHPVTILVSIFVWGRLLGAPGLLLAVPLTAALKILAREIILPVLAQTTVPVSSNAGGNVRGHVGE